MRNNQWTDTTIGELCDDGVLSTQTGPFGSQLHKHDYVASGIPVVPTEAIGRRLLSYSPARHPPCVDGSPVWPPDRDVYSTLQHATELASVEASFGSATCPAARLTSTWASQSGKPRDGNGAAIWLPNLASTWTSQGGKTTIRKVDDQHPTEHFIRIGCLCWLSAARFTDCQSGSAPSKLAPQAAKTWVERLPTMDEKTMTHLFEDVPAERMSQITREFSVALVLENRQRILGALHS